MTLICAAVALALCVTLMACLALGCGAVGIITGAAPTPVSGTDTMGTMALPSSTGTGNASIHGRITYAGAEPTGSVLVILKDVSGDDIAETYAHDSFTLVGLTPGAYRLAVYTMQTGYISQWYGGLPVDTHPASDSQILDVGPGRTEADFTLEPGRSIQGHVAWSGAERDAGWVWACDSAGVDTGHGAAFHPHDRVYLIVGLLPGQYKIGATADDPQEGPKVWYGGGNSFEEARVVDVTQGDAAGIDIDLGTLPPTTVPVFAPTTIP